jgi:hypothetical protein
MKQLKAISFTSDVKNGEIFFSNTKYSSASKNSLLAA